MQARLAHPRMSPRGAARGEPAADPFSEHRRPRHELRFSVLGTSFRFESDSLALLALVRRAYQGLPSHRLAPLASARVTLRVLPAPTPHEPPGLQALGAPGVFAALSEGAALAALSPPARSALVAVPPALLRHPYEVRYELIEFAVYMLAARTRGLMPLHGACIGRAGEGILLLGDSGAGKSTLALASLLERLEFVAEDSVLVEPHGLRATGVANFLHLRPDALRFVQDARLRTRLSAAPRIRRRSGIEKLEIDLRRPLFRLAPAPLRLRALVFLTANRRSARQPLLQPITRARSASGLARTQRYAAGHRGWRAFSERLQRLPVFELARPRHPQEAAQTLARLCAGSW